MGKKPLLLDRAKFAEISCLYAIDNKVEETAA